ncbi:hypothetical protein L596_013950 [Steinernema carpocapsae]|uniref:F-box domain-containing protein n=1 Tax=Steinernema carpocapsae TaxID=34508 RepID=A0A4U5NBD2_STECR|nr:hypothetical protein L596_013950 [Steinernema carpocapsae]
MEDLRDIDPFPAEFIADLPDHILSHVLSFVNNKTATGFANLRLVNRRWNLLAQRQTQFRRNTVRFYCRLDGDAKLHFSNKYLRRRRFVEPEDLDSIPPFFDIRIEFDVELGYEDEDEAIALLRSILDVLPRVHSMVVPFLSADLFDHPRLLNMKALRCHYSQILFRNHDQLKRLESIWLHSRYDNSTNDQVLQTMAKCYLNLPQFSELNMRMEAYFSASQVLTFINSLKNLQRKIFISINIEVDEFKRLAEKLHSALIVRPTDPSDFEDEDEFICSVEFSVSINSDWVVHFDFRKFNCLIKFQKAGESRFTSRAPIQSCVCM